MLKTVFPGVHSRRLGPTGSGVPHYGGISTATTKPASFQQIFPTSLSFNPPSMPLPHPHHPQLSVPHPSTTFTTTSTTTITLPVGSYISSSNPYYTSTTSPLAATHFPNTKFSPVATSPTYPMPLFYPQSAVLPPSPSTSLPSSPPSSPTSSTTPSSPSSISLKTTTTSTPSTTTTLSHSTALAPASAFNMSPPEAPYQRISPLAVPNGASTQRTMFKVKWKEGHFDGIYPLVYFPPPHPHSNLCLCCFFIFPSFYLLSSEIFKLLSSFPYFISFHFR